MKSIQRLIVVALLGIWCFPAVSVANPPPAPSAPVGAPAATGASQAPSAPSTQAEGTTTLGEPELEDLQNFR